MKSVKSIVKNLSGRSSPQLSRDSDEDLSETLCSVCKTALSSSGTCSVCNWKLTPNLPAEVAHSNPKHVFVIEQTEQEDKAYYLDGKRCREETEDEVLKIAQQVERDAAYCDPTIVPRYVPTAPPLHSSVPHPPAPRLPCPIGRSRPPHVPLEPRVVQAVQVQPPGKGKDGTDPDQIITIAREDDMNTKSQHTAMDEFREEVKQDMNKIADKMQDKQDKMAGMQDKMAGMLGQLEQKLDTAIQSGSISSRNSRVSSKFSSKYPSRYSSRAQSPTTQLIRKAAKKLHHGNPTTTTVPVNDAVNVRPVVHQDKQSKHRPNTQEEDGRQVISGYLEYNCSPNSMVTESTQALWIQARESCARQVPFDSQQKPITSWSILTNRNNQTVFQGMPKLVQSDRLQFTTFLHNMRFYFIQHQVDSKLYLLTVLQKVYPELQTVLQQKLSAGELLDEGSLIEQMSTHLFAGFSYSTVRHKFELQIQNLRKNNTPLLQINNLVIQRQLPILTCLHPLAKRITQKNLADILYYDFIQGALTSEEKSVLGMSGHLDDPDINGLLRAQASLALYQNKKPPAPDFPIQNVSGGALPTSGTDLLDQLFPTPPAPPTKPSNAPAKPPDSAELNRMRRELAKYKKKFGSADSPGTPTPAPAPPPAASRRPRLTLLCRVCLDQGLKVEEVDRSCGHCYSHSKDGRTINLSDCPEEKCRAKYRKIQERRERLGKNDE